MVPKTEVNREEEETSFTAILRALLDARPEVQAVGMVDAEGEMVDFCSRIAPYDAKIVAAHLQILVRHFEEALQAGVLSMSLRCQRLDFLTHALGEGYILAAATEPGSASDWVEEGMTLIGQALQREARIQPASRLPATLSVDIRSSRPWGYAPAAIGRGSRHVLVEAVLGRWVDASAQTTCFRVRTRPGEELSVCWHQTDRRWISLPDEPSDFLL